MWIFTKYGFYSFVCARQGEGGYHEPVDPDRIMVRCRLKAHLVALKGRFRLEDDDEEDEKNEEEENE